MGPKMDKVPIQNSRIAVDRPSASLEPPLALSKSPWNLPSKSKRVPMMVPIAMLAIKSTG